MRQRIHSRKNAELFIGFVLLLNNREGLFAPGLEGSATISQGENGNLKPSQGEHEKGFNPLISETSKGVLESETIQTPQVCSQLPHYPECTEGNLLSLSVPALCILAQRGTTPNHCCTSSQTGSNHKLFPSGGLSIQSFA